MKLCFIIIKTKYLFCRGGMSSTDDGNVTPVTISSEAPLAMFLMRTYSPFFTAILTIKHSLIKSKTIFRFLFDNKGQGYEDRKTSSFQASARIWRG